ncbi:MAG: GNAT family N-acetyltransferase [Myxococcota bacterium]
MDVPVLESERLRLRGHRLDDYPAIAAAWADPVVVRHISGTPQTANESWSRLLRYVGHWQLMGYGFWALEERGTGAYLGELGFGDFHRDITPPLEDVPEAGWVLAPHAHGKGYALEAMRVALSWIDARHRRTQCIISPTNRASQKLAAKLGYVPSHDARHGEAVVTAWFRGA